MFRGMEYVYQVWLERSFSETAKKLYISQPALSNSVKRVEEKVGAPIFDRSTAPIQLTDVGQEYIRAVERIRVVQEDFFHYLADRQELKTGTLSIGSGAMLSSYILPALLAGYQEKYPFVEISVVESGTAALKKQLMEGALDLVIENCVFPEPLFEKQILKPEHMILAVPKGWEINRELLACQQSIDNIISDRYLLPRYPAVPLDAFRDAPFLLLSPDDENYQRAVSICQRHGFQPRAVLTLNQQLTSYNMACEGLGAAFVSDTLVKGCLPNPNVVFYKLNGEEAAREISFYYKRNRYIPRCMEMFLQEVRLKAGLFS